MYDLTTLEKALKNESKNFDFFRAVLNRVKAIYFRGENNNRELADAEFDEMFLHKTIDDLAAVKIQFLEQIINQAQKIEFETDTPPSTISSNIILALNFYAISVILSAYRHCSREESQKNNSFNKLLFAEDTHNYLVDAINDLGTLEDIVSRSYTDEVVFHFEKKAVERTIEQERKPQSKGGLIKAEKNNEKNQHIKEEAIRVYKNPAAAKRTRWASRNDFARYFALNYNKNISNAKEWIKESTIKAWIKEYLENGQSASRTVKLVAKESKY